jgi:5-carboxymethyl-2-hydroxymuconate isomerase
MPTIKIHYTNNIDIKNKIDTYIQKTHKMLVDVIGTNLDTCRTLIYPCSQYMVGGDNTRYTAFIQLEIAILPGRDVQLRQYLGEILLNEVKTLCRDSSERIDFRVVVVETDNDFYFGL